MIVLFKEASADNDKQALDNLIKLAQNEKLDLKTFNKNILIYVSDNPDMLAYVKKKFPRLVNINRQFDANPSDGKRPSVTPSRQESHRSVLAP